MISFQVNDMTCGHCVKAITEAVKSADQGATVQIDLATHRLDIETDATDVTGLAKAIKEAGYTPIAVEGGSALKATAPAAKRGGCCCS